MIDPPRIANLLSAGQHNLNYFVVRKEKIKCQINKVSKGLNSSQSYHLKCFMVTHSVHKQKQLERIEIFTLSGLSLSRPVDTKLTSI